MRQALGAVGLNEFGVAVDLLARHGCQPPGIDGLHAAAVFNGAVKHAKAATPQLVRKIHQLHFKAGIRLIGAVVFHGVLPGHARQGQLEIDALDLLEDTGKDVLDHGVNILFINEGHFDVALRKLRLTVCAVVLIAEAAGDLIILVEAGKHQQLLVDLRALRQRVERTGMLAAGHQEIARALRRRFGQDRRFDLGKAPIRQAPCGCS